MVAYVDGFNLYFGMRSQRLRHCYWLDVPAAIGRLLESGERLVETKYFTSRVSGPPDKVRRQNEYLDALATRPNIRMFFGVYQTHERRCASCDAVWQWHNEKMTDVNIAVELLTDAYRDAFDTALLVSADSDLAAPISAIRSLLPGKRVVVLFPFGRGSVRLEQLAHQKRRMRRWVVEAFQMPDEVTGLDGYIRRRPSEWSRTSNDPQSGTA